MRCKRANQLMASRLDDRLDRSRATELEDHLAGCAECRTEWRKLAAVDQLFKSAPMVSAPVHLQAQITARINRRDQARRAIVGGLALALGAATLTMLTLVPAGIRLLENVGVAPALLIGGAETAQQLLVVADGLSRTLLALLDQFARPVMALSLVSLAIALALNGVWVAAMRRLRVAGG